MWISAGDEMQIDHQEYDQIHIGVSGGKDSTAVLLWAVYESGWPKEKLVVTFCDTDNEDPLTYGYLALLDELVFPIRRIVPKWKNGQEIGFYELAKLKRRFPSRKARFCTEWLKIIPSREFVKGLTGRVLIINGVRKAEGHSGNNRGDVPEFEFDPGWAADIYRPILSWGLEDVWEIAWRYLPLEAVIKLVQDDRDLSLEHKVEMTAKIREHGIPRNPLYDFGASRVGCFPCINSRKAEIRALAKYRPERIEFIAQKEREVGGD